MSAPVRLAIGLENPRLLATVLGWIEDADEGTVAFRVRGRPCIVTRLCGSVREVQAAVASPEVDALLTSSVLHAIPLDELRALAEAAAGRLVVLAPDNAAAQWDGFPGPVLEAEPSRAQLIEALEQAALGRAPGRAPRRQRAVAAPSTSRTEEIGPATDAGGTSCVITSVSSDGATTFAAALAFATGMVAPTVALDANWAHGSSLEYQFGADPELNTCLLAHREPKTEAEWTAALRAELQSAGRPLSLIHI